MAGEEYVVKRFTGLIARYTRAGFVLDMYTYGARAVPALLLSTVGLVALFPGFGFFGGVSTVFFFSVVVILIRILSFLGEAVTAAGRVITDVRVAFDLDEVLDRSRLPASSPVAHAATAVREIKFDDLAYAYKIEHAVIAGISGRLTAGTCYALVGRSGSGKSTFADLLLGLLSPQGGELSLNGTTYSELNMSSLRRRVVLVEQQTRIFSGTIWDNIAFGLTPTSDQMQLAVDTAGLQEFVNSLTDGLNTQIDYQGANLSGGQRQRIGLARALIRQPDVLILDEATSALDSQTRDAIIKSVRDMFRHRILLFVTHDSSVIKWADEVWHIRKGKLSVEPKGETV
jgi:ATP-binding cassette subfamily B protein